MNPPQFRTVSKRIAFELLIVGVLVGDYVRFPKGQSYAEGWGFVFAHPFILLHVIISVVVLAEAAILLSRSIRSHRRSLIVWASIGLIFVATAFICGERFVATQQIAVLRYMLYAGLLSLLVYGLGGFVAGRRSAKSHHKTS